MVPGNRLKPGKLPLMAEMGFKIFGLIARNPVIKTSVRSYYRAAGGKTALLGY